MTRGAAVSQLRAVIYQRVSSEEQVEGYSLAAQERAGRHYAEAHGWQLVRVYADEGRSARTEDISKRPAFAHMLQDAEAGQFDVLIVHKLDRFARNLIVTLETLQRLERAGVGFTSISENMDFTTPIGKVILATLAAFAQYYSDNLSTETKKGKAERKRQGMYNGLLPFGVTKDSRGVPIPDMTPWACNIATRQELVPAEGLRMAFELAAGGASDRDVAIALTRAGYRTSGNRGQNPFSKDTVRPLLQNRFYVGELPDGDDWLPGKHSPIIDADLFEQVQQRRVERGQGKGNRSGVRRGARIRALSGLLRCAECGSPMRVQSGEYYRCSAGHQMATCDQPGVSIPDLDAQVGALVHMFSFPEERIRHFLAAVRLEPTSSAADTTSQRSRITSRLTRLKELYLEGDLGREEYQRQRTLLRAELEVLPVASYEPTGEERLREIGSYLSNLGSAWNEATSEERHAIVSELFSAIYVANREAVAVVPRPALRAFIVPVLDTGTAHRRKRRDSNPRSQP
jgi:site-specific DNA recombinase